MSRIGPLLGSMLIAGSMLVLALVFSFGGIAEAAPAERPARQATPTWEDVPPFPTTSFTPLDRTPVAVNPRLKRAGAAAFPDTGKLYVFGGRHGMDGEDLALPYIYEYTPGAPGSWARKSAELPHTPGIPTSRYSANLAAATLNNGTSDVIYVVGGSNMDAVPTGQVRVYNPYNDTLTVLSSDPWPADPPRLPGGWAVAGNKLYIFGGYTSRPAPQVFADTWVFDPLAPAGAKWSRLTSANLGLARGFIAGAAVDGKLYAIGGDTPTGSEPNVGLAPQTIVEALDLGAVAPTWVTVAPLPAPRGDIQAWGAHSQSGVAIAGRIVVAGGPWYTPETASYIYTVATNSWATYVPLRRATRNYAAAMLDGFLYALGGYDFSGGRSEGQLLSQRLDVRIAGATPTQTRTPSLTPTRTQTPLLTNTPVSTPTGIPTSTRTPTGIPTSTASPTPCVMSFADVRPSDYFYEPVLYLYCRGIIAGYQDGTFRPFADTTRGQLTKIIVGAAGWPIDATDGPHFTDVSINNTFYEFIETAYNRGVISGYSDGSFRPFNPVTRGQLSKIVVAARGWTTLNPSNPTFRDVSPTNPFYREIETAVARGIISGYDLPGGTREFRWGNNATRGQISKIVYMAVTQP